ncbi:asparagine synthase-related protein [Thermosynechococcaceae cyanobacterium BACA0444]|uniref:asparagine synthase (glutamine-hydrolyzing) n=1 Tax=Pseudocalidococcus azoricus BACA0444 TaxID=2918990 RepID=A0AAE4K062_9CYAN|nr:asparagine synthase-related protein [Pseudocalidococcus azoricus]MDS3861612.1 asparagine synthase-related protein [Pseudocalidococcus azoricus BACA0444]
MTKFYGLYSLRHELNPDHHLSRVGATSDWSRTGHEIWQEGPILFYSRLLRINPHDAFELQPLVTEDFVLVGQIRLDDRYRLGQDLGVNYDQLSQLSDSQLFLQAWQNWGQNCVDYLYGDWACGIWDRHRQSLWLGRDAGGNRGLYYWHNSQWLIFSNSLKTLLAHPFVPKQPNAYQIARQLALVMDPSQEGATAYAEIRRLPVGNAIRCHDAKVELYTWWRPENLSELDWADDEDYYQAFRELYRTAVSDRLSSSHGPVGLMFSSGLDSGSIASLAAPILKKQNETLQAYTSVPQFQPDGASRRRLGDETGLAQACAAYIGDINFIPVFSTESSIIYSLEKLLEIHDRPGHAAVNYYWILDILTIAQAQGIKVMLTGQGGNATVSFNGSGTLWPYLLHREWQRFLTEFCQSRVGTWQTLKGQILRPLVQPFLEILAHLKTLNQAPWGNDALIGPELVAEVNLWARMEAMGYHRILGASQAISRERIKQFRLGGLGGIGEIWMELGAAHHMDVRDPTRDRRIIEFCWRVPDRIFWAKGLQRGLIRQGMAGSLPKMVLHSKRKGLQAADIGYRVWAQRDAISTTLDKLEAHSLAQAWLDIPKMRLTLAELATGITPAKTVRVSSLLRGIGVGLFLMRF